MATPRVAAGALILDELGRILLVKPHYKQGWDIPGGYVEPTESPLAACIRELQEELNLSPDIGSLLIVDWAPAANEGDKLLFVFDAGILTQPNQHEIQLLDGELTDWQFVAAADLDRYVPPRLSRRLRTAIEAKQRRTPTYAEHGTAWPGR